ncbi:TPA: molecular chaperone, partial [Providencia stuartii]|nr:molecular chaperone [Providencia stuartii]
YRPNNLPISIEDAYKKLVIKSSPSGVVVENNSPYYINLNRLVVGGKKVSLSLQKKNTMIAPYSSYSYTVGGGLNNKQATWVVINDLGGEEKYDGQIL